MLFITYGTNKDTKTLEFNPKVKMCGSVGHQFSLLLNRAVSENLYPTSSVSFISNALATILLFNKA
jgi:hypothetical protein